MATNESQQFPFFLQAAMEQAGKLEALDTSEARSLARTMRVYEETFRKWNVSGRPNDAQMVISDFLTASRRVMDYLSKV